MTKSKFTKQIRISIIIIVKNDRAIECTLIALQKINLNNYVETIVVDSSNGSLNDIVNKFPKVQWIRYKSDTSKSVSIPEQRNKGVKVARGKIIVFIDANCIPEKNWLIKLTKPILDNDENIVSGKTKSTSHNSAHDLFYHAHENTKYLDECATINLALHKVVFAKIGLFDERFEYGSDADFTWRAVNAGFKIRYIKEAVVSHDWGDSRREMKRSYLYGKARARLYLKHKNRLLNLFTKEYYILAYVFYILFFPVTIIFPFYPLLILIFVIKNINSHPISLVGGHLIYAVGFIFEFLQYD